MNTVVDERKSKYGLTKIEDDEYVWLIDLGYSRIIKEKLTIHPELSFGKRIEFTNYKDNRFIDNGYSLITNKESIVGIGINFGYLITKNFEPFLGYNSLKNVNIGFRYTFFYL